LCEVCTLCADSEFVLDSQDGVSIRNPASPWVTKDTNNISKQVLAGGGGGGDLEFHESKVQGPGSINLRVLTLNL
jgi:hypothetical protein